MEDCAVMSCCTMALGQRKEVARRMGLIIVDHMAFFVHRVSNTNELCRRVLGLDGNLARLGACSLRAQHMLGHLNDRLRPEVSLTLDILTPTESMNKAEKKASFDAQSSVLAANSADFNDTSTAYCYTHGAACPRSAGFRSVARGHVMQCQSIW